MYQWLLTWRYLRTRYIALASIISVTLGVATMIVVNSVMEGFTREMQDRIHGMLSDVVVESHGLEGYPNPEWHMQEIRRVAGPYIASLTPTVQVPGMLSFPFRGSHVKRQVQIVGIDPKTQSITSDFGKYLLHPENRRQMSFTLREEGFDRFPDQAGGNQHERKQLASAGWKHRRLRALWEKEVQQLEALRATRHDMPAGSPQVVPSPTAEPAADSLADLDGPTTAEPVAAAPDLAQPAPPPDIVSPLVEAGPRATEQTAVTPSSPADPFASREEEHVYDPLREQSTGLVLGIALGSFRGQDGNDRFLVLPGDDVKLTFPNAANPPRPVDASFTVVDLYESRMSEYDSSLVFVPLDRLQELCGMLEPATGVRYVNSIQIKLHRESDGPHVRDLLRSEFSGELYAIDTWRDKQGVLLAAVQMETLVLNLLLFLIIAVAGFGILAIFFMIVVEKTRDIGILKSLGAPRQGVQNIFLGYGLSLGLVGAGAGLILGLLFVANINTLAHGLSRLRGREVFDPSMYNFYEIPTIIEPLTIAWIVSGAVLIAVLASILPARRAARLHPVEALRYE